MIFFSFHDTVTSEIYTLSLHDALPICLVADEDRRVAEHLRREDRDGDHRLAAAAPYRVGRERELARDLHEDRKSTRLNSSHRTISYAVFCLKKKKKSLAANR